MKYTEKSFTVPASSRVAPAHCDHQWVDEKRGRCVLCGDPVPPTPTDAKKAAA